MYRNAYYETDLLLSLIFLRYILEDQVITFTLYHNEDNDLDVVAKKIASSSIVKLLSDRV